MVHCCGTGRLCMAQSVDAKVRGGSSAACLPGKSRLGPRQPRVCRGAKAAPLVAAAAGAVEVEQHAAQGVGAEWLTDFLQHCHTPVLSPFACHGHGHKILPLRQAHALLHSVPRGSLEAVVQLERSPDLVVLQAAALAAAARFALSPKTMPTSWSFQRSLVCQDKSTLPGG